MKTVHNTAALDEARDVLVPQSLADIIERAHDEILDANDLARQTALAFLEVAHERLIGHTHDLSADCWCAPTVEAVDSQVESVWLLRADGYLPEDAQPPVIGVFTSRDKAEAYATQATPPVQHPLYQEWAIAGAATGVLA